jgi:hypothetical protein
MSRMAGALGRLAHACAAVLLILASRCFAQVDTLAVGGPLGSIYVGGSVENIVLIDQAGRVDSAATANIPGCTRDADDSQNTPFTFFRLRDPRGQRYILRFTIGAMGGGTEIVDAYEGPWDKASCTARAAYVEYKPRRTYAWCITFGKALEPGSCRITIAPMKLATKRRPRTAPPARSSH